MSEISKTILIIEDESDLREFLELRLQCLGYDVIIAKDGQEGLKKAKEEKVDLIILDLMLPKLPGEAVCKQIRKDASIGEVPIIMVTGKGQASDKVIGKVIGADSYIVKPFDSSVLASEIKRLI
ncbi:MAG: response regulator [Candidatus Omnitrophica bacterium]|jgi:two-component system alkaline phosphatase synthesis response regulator PhoP|nr:response regulator [Candidatus Omnitrophota bacterium]MDD5691226.1 response regulator [Candidatus Omnitrophota bacterium]